MSKSTEKSKFENRFTENIIEVAVVTGASGVGAGKCGKDILWNASIDLIAYKNLSSNESVIKEEIQLEWLADDEELNKSRDIIKSNSIIKAQVRTGKKSMMLLKVIETEYEDEELDIILKESMKPVFYKDEILGEFELDKRVKLFEKNILWAKEEGSLYFDWNEDINIMKDSLKTAHILFKNQDELNMKVREYACEELVELANDWLQDNEDADIDEITKEMFVNLMELDSISVYPEGDFNIFFFDGDMFWGHSIIVSGNINGNFTSAEIAG